MKKVIGTSIASIALLVSATAIAQPAQQISPDGSPPPIGKLGTAPMKSGFILNADANKDGKISLDEFKANATERAVKNFENLDANKDGFVTKEEFEKARADRREERREFEKAWAEHRNEKKDVRGGPPNLPPSGQIGNPGQPGGPDNKGK